MMPEPVERQKETERKRTYQRAWRAANPNYKQEMREYRLKNPERFREYERNRKRSPQTRKEQGLKRVYGVNVDTWNKIFESQGRRCAICGSTSPRSKHGVWSTDHNHKIKIKHVRGILCSPCNVALGMFCDDISKLRAAISYLEAAAVAEGALRETPEADRESAPRKETSMIDTPGRYQITATYRHPEGSIRTEDLGTHEATTGQSAKRRAQNLHAGRLGWRGPRIPKGWSFKSALVKP